MLCWWRQIILADPVIVCIVIMCTDIIIREGFVTCLFSKIKSAIFRYISISKRQNGRVNID